MLPVTSRLTVLPANSSVAIDWLCMDMLGRGSARTVKSHVVVSQIILSKCVCIIYIYIYVTSVYVQMVVL